MDNDAIPKILLPFTRTLINYNYQRGISSYSPSSLMMDYVLHQINYHLVDNLCFKRTSPDYHPYVLRLYYAILFWVQCLRAGHDVNALDSNKYCFLTHFLDCFPAESLPIAGPLIPVFQTLCSSQPEFETFGKVYPKLPRSAGPTRRDEFFRESLNAFFLPNVPGIFALLEHLDSLINNADKPIYPNMGAHTPVPADSNLPTVFGHHSFPASQERSDHESWSLCTSGLQYPCEADSMLNQAFARRYSNFDFPVTKATDNLKKIGSFLSLSKSMAWFAQVKNVAAKAAAYFEGSGTLADCAPTGVMSNQIMVQLRNPGKIPTIPTCSADCASLCKFGFCLVTSLRAPTTLSLTMASMAQTNIIMFDKHPYFSQFGSATIAGDFWMISPNQTSVPDCSLDHAISDVVRKMMKTNN